MSDTAGLSENEIEDSNVEADHISLSNAVDRINIDASEEINSKELETKKNEESKTDISVPSDFHPGDAGDLTRDLHSEKRVESDSDHIESYASEDIVNRVGTNETRASSSLQPDLVVLDPDHPLMIRFQNALKNHLVNQITRIKLANREMAIATKQKTKNREDLGVRLYGMQQELAKQQSSLEGLHDIRNKAAEKRQHKEVELDNSRKDYKENKMLYNKDIKTNRDLQSEGDNLATRLFHMNNLKTDVRSDISVMKRAAERADLDVTHLEVFKKRQDLYVDRLQTQVHKLREDISMYEAQQTAQAEDTLAARQALTDAEEEVSAIKLEKKQLYQQWNASLTGMKRRDEAYSAMQEALNIARQEVRSLETEIVGYKKSTQKAEEKNETLTVRLNKMRNERDMVKSSIQGCLERQDSLKQQYATYSRTLHETEHNYNKALMEKSTKQSELTVIRKQTEKEYLEKVKLEDEIMKELQTQLTSVKAKEYTIRKTNELRARKTKLERDMASIENEGARYTLQFTEKTSKVENLKRALQAIEKEIHIKNEMIDRIDKETSKRNSVIMRKQNSIDVITKKISNHIEAMGGQEIGPLEMQINSLNKEISEVNEQVVEQQQHWLREQQDLVRISRKRDSITSEVNTMKKAENILRKKKQRIETEFEFEEREMQEQKKQSKRMRILMVKLNTKVKAEMQKETNVEQGNLISEMEFVAELKELELASIKAQEKLQFILDEKERLLHELINAERGIMLWEKKTQLARETKAAVDVGVGKEEMHAMQAEIHRMEVRYSQLMKQQEHMIREMEQSVTRRDFISYQGDAIQKKSSNNKKGVTMGNFQRKLIELQNKIKSTKKDINACDIDIKQLREHQVELATSLEEKQKDVQLLQQNLDQLSAEIENLFDSKQRNLNEIIAKQTKVKHLMSLKEGKYTKLCKTEPALKAEIDKQENRFHHTINILDRVSQEFPHSRQALRRVATIFTSSVNVTS